MKTTAQEKGERQPKAASEKRRPGLKRFSLAVAASLLLGVLATGNTHAVGNDAGRGSQSLWTTLSAQAVVASGTRFVNDVRLLYQISQLRESFVPAERPMATAAPQANVKICKAEPASLPPATRAKKIRL